VNSPDALICDCGFNFETGRQGTPIQGAATDTPHGLASLEDRLGAQLIDAVIALAVFFASLPFHRLGDAAPAIAFALALLYLLLADGLPGKQSLGKRIAKIAVVDVRTGAPCTLAKSAVRNALGFLGLLDWVFIFGRERRRLVDLLAGTSVTRRLSRS